MSGKVLTEDQTSQIQTAWNWTVDENFASERADLAITSALKSGKGKFIPARAPSILTRSRIQKLMSENRVRANERSLRPSARLALGDQIIVEIPDPRPIRARAEDLPINCLYEDEHLMVINKPQGQVVHPAPGSPNGTLVNAILHHASELSGIGGELRPGIVHRLDRDTSGVLIVAKSDLAHERISHALAQRRIKKTYWALCFGAPSESEGTIDLGIARNPKHRKKMMGTPDGRRALTHYRVLKRYLDFASLLELKIETGRTHQIRVHLTDLGNSVLGDRTYGAPSNRQPKWLALPPEIREEVEGSLGQYLHSRKIEFNHPVTQKKLKFVADPPHSFRRLLEDLKGYELHPIPASQ